jgi:hypothetical protein
MNIGHHPYVTLRIAVVGVASACSCTYPLSRFATLSKTHRHQTHASPVETHMDVVVEESTLVIEKSIAPFAARAWLLAAIPILGSICYAACYVTGLVYRQVYLGRFNVPETLFKSDASDYFIYAYQAVLETLKNWTTFISSPWVWLSIIGFIVAICIEMIGIYKLPDTLLAKSVAKTLGRNKYIAVTTGLLTFSTAITTVLLLIPVMLFPLILLPAIAGTYGANRTLDRNLELYDKGCDHPTDPKDYCQVIMDGTRIVATGFLVTASNTRVVIYEHNKAKIISVKNYTIETLPPKDYLALVADKKVSGLTDAKGGQP